MTDQLAAALTNLWTAAGPMREGVTTIACIVRSGPMAGMGAVDTIREDSDEPLEGKCTYAMRRGLYAPASDARDGLIDYLEQMLALVRGSVDPPISSS